MLADLDLEDRRVLVLVGASGLGRNELVVPVGRLRREGASVDVATVHSGPTLTRVDDGDPEGRVGGSIPVDEVDD